MNKYEILVTRDKTYKKTILSITIIDEKGELTKFLIKNQKPIKILGESIPYKARKQIWAISNKSELAINPRKVLNKLRVEKLLPKFNFLVKDRLVALSQTGINPLAKGAIRVSYQEKYVDKAKKTRTKNVQSKLVSLPDAIRQQTHILKTLGYNYSGGEKKQLLDYETTLLDINHLLVNWRKTDIGKRSKIILKLSKTIEQLENCRNPHKVDIYTKLINIHQIKDILGRDNPGATAASIISILGLLAKRITDIEFKIPAKLLRLHLLNIELDIHKYHCNEADEQIIRALKYYYDDTKVLDNVLYSRIISMAQKRLDYLFLSPFTLIAKKCSKNLESSKRHFDNNKHFLAIRLLLRTHHLLANELPFFLNYCSIPTADRDKKYPF